MNTPMSQLWDSGIIYRNNFFVWAFAPSLVSKPRPVRWCFTADLQPDNRYAIQNDFLMTNFKYER